MNRAVCLFDPGDLQEKKITRIGVMRTDPAEGHLGFVEPDANEVTIKSRWGGGSFRLEAKNEQGRVVKVRSLIIAGDPVFESDIAEARWRRLNGLPPRAQAGTQAQQQQQQQDVVSFKEMMMLFDQKESQRRREEQEREERRRREEQEREERREKADRAAHERQLQLLREDTERRERLAKEEHARLAQEHERQIQRERESQTALAAQNQQFFTNMLAMVKQDAAKVDNAPSAVDIMKSTVEMVSMLKEGQEPQDAVTALINRLPETLAEARETAKHAIREIKGEGAATSPEPDGTRAETNDSLTLTGRTATEVKAFVRHLVAHGKDPRVVISKIVQHLMRGKPGKSGRPKGRPPKHIPAPSPDSPSNGAAPGKKIGRPPKRAPPPARKSGKPRLLRGGK